MPVALDRFFYRRPHAEGGIFLCRIGFCNGVSVVEFGERKVDSIDFGAAFFHARENAAGGIKGDPGFHVIVEIKDFTDVRGSFRCLHVHRTVNLGNLISFSIYRLDHFPFHGIIRADGQLPGARREHSVLVGLLLGENIGHICHYVFGLLVLAFDLLCEGCHAGSLRRVDLGFFNL